MSTPRLFDVHTHVQFAAFDTDRDAVIQRALGAGIWTVNVGTQKDTSAAAIALTNKFAEGLPAEALSRRQAGSAKAGVYATVGLHPIHTERSYHDAKELGASSVFSNSRELENRRGSEFTSRGEEFDYEYYKKLAQDPKVVAVGECGLDYYRLESQTKTKQEAAFIQQIELAHEIGKPLMVHCRNAFPDLIKILDSKFQILVSTAGVVHFFSGTKEDAQKLLDLGFSFTFGGVITFARDYDEVIKYIPLERLLVETDAPYVAPVPYRGKRNEPAYVVEVAKKLAELKNISFDEICAITKENTAKVFNIAV